MDTGSEITAKIRSAIKAKLVELGAYVDEELPDYIMVMIANKKTKDQMTNDLNLFLGKSATVFTDWVHSVLDRLQAISQKAASSTCVITSSSSSSKVVANDNKKQDVVVVRSSSSKKERSSSSSVVETSKEQQNKFNVIKKDDDKRLERKKVTYDNIEIKHSNNKSLRNNDCHDNIIVNNNDSWPQGTTSRSSFKPHQSSTRAEKKLKNDVTLKRSHRRISRTVVSPISSVSDEGIRSSRHNQITKHHVVSQKSEPQNRKRRGQRLTITSNENKNDDDNDEDYEDELEYRKKKFIISSTVNIPERKVKISEKLSPKPSIFLKALSEANASVSRLRATITQEEAGIKKRHIVQIGRLTDELQIPISFQDKSNCDYSPCHDDEAHSKMPNIQTSRENTPYHPIVTIKTKTSDVEYVPTPIEKISVEQDSKFAHRRKVERKAIRIQRENNDNEIETVIVDPTERSQFSDTTKFFVTLDGLNPELVQKFEGVVTSLQDHHHHHQYPMTSSMTTDYDEVGKTPPTIVLTPTVSQQQQQPAVEEFDAQVVGLDDDMDTTQFIEHEMDENQNESTHNTTNEIKICLDDEEEEDEEQAKTIKSDTTINAESIKRESNFTPENIEQQQQQQQQQQLDSIKKTVERCKYWPNCKLDSACQYHHPIVSCKAFPTCRYGDRCLYIHPKCRFDKYCTNVQCPFSHTFSNNNPTSQSSYASKASLTDFVSHTANKLCKFSDRCTNSVCAFKHPKPCMYGTSCLKLDCSFAHPFKASSGRTTSGGNLQKFKWVAKTNANL